jgi:hypothetical protein
MPGWAWSRSELPKRLMTPTADGRGGSIAEPAGSRVFVKAGARTG